MTALRAFESAARAGSFKIAADELNVSPSAVSHQIKHLEEYLGVLLFYRRARSIELTPAGRVFYPYLQTAFEHIEEGTRHLRDKRKTDELTIQTYSTIAVRWLMPRIQSFQSKHPKLVIRLITAQTDPDFADEAIDLAVVIATPESKRLTYTYLFTPTMFPVCSPQLISKFTCPADLARAAILQVYPSRGDWPQWLAAHNIEGVDPDSGLRFDSYDHALRMAARGHGVALAMQPYVDDDLATGVLQQMFPGMEVEAKSSWYLAWPASRSESRYVRAFARWLIHEVEHDPTLMARRRSRV
jgi:DNA-binding transcriptional LysR family regulator